ncbi:MAG: hypothetical protein K8T89_06440, partial [Planctomycetes bacterium]|nr:hypothetical protein [Planctomycetota bacterium]
LMRAFLARLTCVAVVLGLALPARAIDPKYLPPNTEIVITVNVKQILESDLLKDKKDLVDQVKAMVKDKINESPAKELLEKADFDPFRDLTSITVTGDGSKDVDSGVVCIEGKFNPEKLADVAKAVAEKDGDKVKITKAGNVTIVEVVPNDNEKPFYAAIVNDSMIVGGLSKDAITKTVARINGGKASTLKPAIKSLLETTNNKQSMSFIATSEGIAKMSENAPKAPGAEAAAIVQSMEGMGLSITLSKDIGFQAAGNFKDDEGVKKINTMANMGLMAGRMMLAQKAKEEPKLAPVNDVLNTVRITTQGTNLVIRAEISQANLEKLLSAIPR